MAALVQCQSEEVSRAGHQFRRNMIIVEIGTRIATNTNNCPLLQKLYVSQFVTDVRRNVMESALLLCAKTSANLVFYALYFYVI